MVCSVYEPHVLLHTCNYMFFLASRQQLPSASGHSQAAPAGSTDVGNG